MSDPDVTPTDLPCKNDGFVEVEWDGSCLRCGVDQGIRCPAQGFRIEKADD